LKLPLRSKAQAYPITAANAGAPASARILRLRGYVPFQTRHDFGPQLTSR
jgi:hypothetical protein